MFGPERAGLETDDVACAQAILTVPVNPAFASLNLAQAVILTAYEWSKAADVQPESVIDNYEGPAAQASVEGLVRQVDDALEARSEAHTSELQSLMRSSYAVFCLKKKKKQKTESI